MNRRVVIGVAAVAVGAMVIGGLVSHALSDGGDPKRALPPAGPTIPLVGPDDGAFGPSGASATAADAGAAPKSNVVGRVQRYASSSGASGASGASGGSAGGSGSGSGSGGGGGGGGGSTATTAARGGTTGSTGGTTATTTGGTTATSAGGTTATTTGAGATGSEPPVPLLIHRFIDPCTINPGVCRGIGFGGTILPITDPPPFEIVRAGATFCSDIPASESDYDVMLEVRSTTPGRFWVHVTGTTDPTARSSTFYDSVTTSHSEQVRWSASGGTTDAVTCLAVPMPGHSDPSGTYSMRVTGVNVPGETQTSETTLTVPWARKTRPPMSVEPGDLFPTERIVATDIPGGPNRVPTAVLAASESGTLFPTICGPREWAAARPLSGGADYDRTTFESPAYPYSREYTQRYQPAYRTATDVITGAEVPFEANRLYVLCVQWTNPRTGEVVEQKTVHLQTPDRYLMQLRIMSTDTPTTGQHTLTLDTFDGGCRMQVAHTAGHVQFISPSFSGEYGDFNSYPTGDPADNAAYYPNGRNSCDQQDPLQFPSASFAYGPPDGTLALDFDVALDGTSFQTSLWVPISPCPAGGGACPNQGPFSENYTIDLGHGSNVRVQVMFQHSFDNFFFGGVPRNKSYAWLGGGSY